MNKNGFQKKLEKFLESNNCLQVVFPEIKDDDLLIVSFVSAIARNEIETAKNSKNFNGWIMTNFRETENVPTIVAPNHYYRMDFKKI